MKPVLAWAVCDEDELQLCRQESRWQYPIFGSRAEARDYAKTLYGVIKILRVKVTAVDKEGK